MGVTLTELRTRVYNVLRDSGQSFITTAMVDDWLNEGYVDLCARLRIPQKTATGTMSSTGTLNLPDDFVAPVAFSVADIIPEFVPDDHFESWKIPADTPGNLVVLARVRTDVGTVTADTTIETYPTTDTASASYSLTYVYVPTLMSVGGDTPKALPLEMIPRIVYYARAEALWVGGDWSEGDKFFERYRSGLPDATRAVERLYPGPNAITVAPGVFD